MERDRPGQTWVSAYDMGCVQAGFVNVVRTKLAAHFGFAQVTLAERERYTFFWRCVGCQLGLADEFNLCGSGFAVADQIMDELTDEILLPYNELACARKLQPSPQSNLS